ncbi:nuclear transport factor 2 family protein [Wenzhouxiangella sp. 15181]|nr:nuclear transport factor 2 family protein [Wenzhouxiangella sp. 15181]RFP67989.1 nuclear transport factor 2 family protein [Wenzhouxiangella sp. 15190]
MLLALFLSTAVLAEGDDQAELASLLETFLDGASVNDAAVHDRFWADDLIYTSSDGQRFGKAEIMASLAEVGSAGQEEPPQPPQYSARDIDIRVFGDSAVVTFRLMASRDGEIVGEYLNTGVFRKRVPGWRAVAWQATRAGQSNGE